MGGCRRRRRGAVNGVLLQYKLLLQATVSNIGIFSSSVPCGGMFTADTVSCHSYLTDLALTQSCDLSDVVQEVASVLWSIADHT